MKKTFYFLLSLILLISCKKDDKSDNFKSVYIGDFSLLPDSRAKFPYFGIKDLIFEDSIKNTVEFKLIKKSDTTFNVIRIDSSKRIQYSYKISQIQYSLKNDSLNMLFMILLYSQYFDSAKAYDNLKIYRNGAGELQILVNQRDLSNDYVKAFLFDTVALKINVFGKVFNNVYDYSNFRKESTKVVFNYDLGIVEFKDKNNKTWVYNRKE